MSKEQETALNEVKSRFGQIYDIVDEGSFVEVFGKIGGDSVTYRVYSNGTVTQR